MRLIDTLFFFGFAPAFGGRSSNFRTHHNEPPRVNLGYATYEGTTQSSGINEFLGMRFASPDMYA
jgi:hypothetical protein